MIENPARSIPTGDGAVTSGLGPVPAAPPGFDLLDEVGRGGMGVVYRARDQALDREVAVKVLLDEYAPDSGAARRFLDEARITGQLQHPGIPAVYQVGTLANGWPFLAMKLIKGQTLADLLKADAAVNRLAVFEAVSQAVGYAHAHGVIHRDLKPQNVMVGAFGEVQVMDWGLAKVLAAGREGEWPESDPEATTAATVIRSERDPETPFTQYGSMLGTPAYMAPEQAAGELNKVGPRSDVFGLGAILCTLLTGRPPYEGKDAQSVRIAAVGGQTGAALARLEVCAADPGVVDLCKRCLAFDPAERPATAEAVAAEVTALRRAVDERARQAERDKLAAEVRAAEQAKRRRAVQWAAGAVAAVLLLGVAGTSVGLYLANEGRKAALAAEGDANAKRVAAERAEAEEAAQRKKAEAETALANAVKEFLQRDVLRLADPEVQQQEGAALPYDADLRLRDVVLRAAERIEGKFLGQPLVEADIRDTLGRTLVRMGRADLALKQFERVREVHREHFGPDHLTTVASMAKLASSYYALHRHDEAVKLREETLALRKVKLGPDHPQTLANMNSLASSYQSLGRRTEALKLYEESLALLKAKHGPDHPAMLGFMNNLAHSYHALGRLDDALKLREETLTLVKAKVGPDHPFTLMCMGNLAHSYRALGRYNEALKLSQETFPLRKAKLGADHPQTILGMYDIVASLVKLDRGAEAVPVIDECVRLAAGKPVDPFIVPAVMNHRLRHFQKAGDPAGCRATAEMWEKLGRKDAESLYKAACWRAAAAAVQKKTPGADAARLATEDADRAMAWLTEAVAAGFRDRVHMEKDRDLDALRGREDFRKLLASLPKAKASAPPAKK